MKNPKSLKLCSDNQKKFPIEVSKEMLKAFEEFLKFSESLKYTSPSNVEFQICIEIGRADRYHTV